jgi:hypothetical protein
MPCRPLKDVRRKRLLSPASRGAGRRKGLSRLDKCGGRSRENLDGPSRGATSINLCVDLRGRPGAGLGVRSLTRRVRDVPGAAGVTRQMLFL